ncbi:vacuolar import and degradation protein-domain-containing protein [Infundibulicybe gibba]|nr:vacuolar import and degradation protein-domain-containing protein [Infundibulicybe gibba]
MPSGHHPVPDAQLQEQPAAQAKVCSSCHSTLVDPSTPVFIPESDPVVCIACRDRFFSVLASHIPTDAHPLCLDSNPGFPRHVETLTPTTRRLQEALSFDDPMVQAPPLIQETAPPYHTSQIPAPSYSKPTLIPIQTASASLSTHSHVSPTLPNSATMSYRHPSRAYPDPLVDISRLRVRAQTHHCLHPGASFQGTQKSGRNSYDVNVTIVDVDFSSSFLCGYLRIRGLTDDWPELTTYFDAEIIGSRHGFLTRNWGANEQEDMVHWSRFPAFRHVKHELKGPYMTMPDRDRGAVFMRWKERFLVPDHRVQDINGASFAGFYYVCVDFNPPTSVPVTTTRSESNLEADEMESTSPTRPVAPTKPDAWQRPRRVSSARRADRSPLQNSRSGPSAATMSGFYFHQNSEPYQQLSLSHIPDHSSSSFEFR